jgi:hypothetical protein
VNNFLTRRMIHEFSQREAKSMWQEIWMPIVQKLTIRVPVSRRDFNRMARGAVDTKKMQQAVATAKEAGYLKLSKDPKGGEIYTRLE